MTDEEKAEEWLDERYLKDMGVRKPCKEAFLAGLKAGKDMAETDLATIAYMQGAERYKTKWHDLQKDPNDVPRACSIVLDENGDKITYCGGGIWTVYSDYYEKDIEAGSPKAWCEIPKFEE